MPSTIQIVTLFVSLAAVPLDISCRRIPNRLTACGFASVLLAASIDAGSGGCVRAVGTGLFCAALPLGIHIIAPVAIGGGDVKLCLVIGAGLGLAGLGVLVMASLLALLWVCSRNIRQPELIRKSEVPFAPFLAAGAFTSVLAV